MSYNPNNPNGQGTMSNSAPVVIASDQSAVPISQKATTVPAATTMQSGATANGNGTSLPATGYTTVVLNIVSSPSMSGGTTVNFEASVDDTTWVSINTHLVGSNTISTSTTSDGDFRINSAGYKSIRARISAYSAGTITIKGYSVIGAGPVTTLNANIVGNTATNQSVNLAQVAGGTAITSGVTGSQAIGGDTAAAATDAGNPVKTGGIAKSSEPTAVTTGQRANFYSDLVGKQIVLPYANPENFTSGTGSATGTGDTAVIAAPGASIRLYITSIIINNSSTTDTFVTIKDGSTAKLVFPAASKSGATIALPTPLRLTANTALNFASNASATTINVSAVGYTGV